VRENRDSNRFPKIRTAAAAPTEIGYCPGFSDYPGFSAYCEGLAVGVQLGMVKALVGEPLLGISYWSV